MISVERLGADSGPARLDVPPRSDISRRADMPKGADMPNRPDMPPDKEETLPPDEGGVTDIPKGTLRVGLTLSHYRIEEKIGQGGLGIVYRARDRIYSADWRSRPAPPRR